MRIPEQFNPFEFLSKLLCWKQSAKWFLKQYTINELKEDLKDFFEKNPIYLSNLDVLNIPHSNSQNDQINILIEHYLNHSLKLIYELITNDYKFNDYFSTKSKISNVKELPFEKEILSKLPIYKTFNRESFEYSITILSFNEIITSDFYVYSYMNLTEIDNHILKTLASKETQPLPKFDNITEWLINQRNINIYQHV